MHGDESELKAAGEEAEHQQHVGAMAERFRERMLEGLLFRRRQRSPIRPAASPAPATAARPAASGRRTPISAVCQPKLSIIATPNGANRNCPNDPAAVPAPSARPRHSGGSSFAERRQHQVERTARQSKADQHAGAEIERAAASRHNASTTGRRHRAARRRRSPARCRNGRRSRRRSAAQAPQQVLDREREAEDIAAPGKFAAHRLHEKAEGSNAARSSTCAIRQPHTTITSGVRQVAASAPGRRLPSVAAMPLLKCCCRSRADRTLRTIPGRQQARIPRS